MSRPTLAALAAALILALSAVPAPTRAADDDADHAAAVKALTVGAAMFEAKDAKGLADTYTDDAVLTVVTKEPDTSSIRTDLYRGRAQIEDYYKGHFKPDSVYHPRNEIDSVRRIGPDVLMITGTFIPDTESADPMTLPFVQVRQKAGDAWRILTLQVFFLPKS